MKDERMSDAADVASGLVDVLRRAADPFDAREREVMTSNATFILRHLTQMLVPVATSADVTAMLEEVTRLDAAATPGPWCDQDTPGQIWTAHDEDGESEALIAEGLEDGDQRFCTRARTLLLALAKALESAEKERAAWKDEAEHVKHLADLRQIAKEDAEARADAAEAKLDEAREEIEELHDGGQVIANQLTDAQTKLEALREKALALLAARDEMAEEGGIITGCSTASLLAFNAAALDLREEANKP